MDLIGAANWEVIKGIIRDAHDTFFQDTLIWKRYISGRDIHGEDKPANYNQIELKVLFQYNEFKVWDLDLTTPSGEEDKENVAVLINLRYLKELGYINSKGLFLYNQDKDVFEHRGLPYKSTGYTLLSQAQEEPLLVRLNLKRDSLPTGTSNHGQ